MNMDCIIDNHSNEELFADMELEVSHRPPRPQKVFTKAKKEPKQRSEGELCELFPEYPPSPTPCHTCSDPTQCKCNYKLSFDAEDSEGYLQALEKYGVVIIKNVISPEDCLQSVNEFINECNEKASARQLEPIDILKPWSFESRNWPSKGKYLVPTPAFTPQSFSNRLSPIIYKVFTNIFQQEELNCSIDNWGVFRPTKDLLFCKEKFIDIVKAKMQSYENYANFIRDHPERTSPDPPPSFDFNFYNFRFLECSNGCENSPLIFFEKIEKLLNEYNQSPPSPPISFLDPVSHSPIYQNADQLLSYLNNNNNNENNIIIEEEGDKKCKGRCKWAVVDRLDWRKNLKAHWDLNPWKYLLERKNGEKDLYQGILAIDDCPEEVGGFCCVPSSHLFLPQWCEENEGSNLKRKTTRIPENDQMQTKLQKLPLRKGEMVIWNSALVHSNFANHSQKFRFIQFIRLLPVGKVNIDKDRYAASRILHRFPDVKEKLERGEIIKSLSDFERSVLSLLPF